MKIAMPYFSNHLQCDQVLDVEIVDVAPHLAGIATFAIHRASVFTDLWRISNIETGRCISEFDHEQKTKCIAGAKVALAAKTVADVERAYRDYRKTRT